MSDLLPRGGCGEGAVLIVNAPMDWKFGDCVDSAALPEFRLGIFKVRQTVGRRIDRVSVHIRWIGGSVNGRWTVVPGKPRHSRLQIPVVTLGAVALVPIKFLRYAVHEGGVIRVRQGRDFQHLLIGA